MLENIVTSLVLVSPALAGDMRHGRFMLHGREEEHLLHEGEGLDEGREEGDAHGEGPRRQEGILLLLHAGSGLLFGRRVLLFS